MARDRSAHSPGGRGPAKGILHVEDDPRTRDEVRGILSVDHEVVSACGLTEALDFARDREFGLYLLGGMFRDGSSLELCYELRLLNPKAPVLIHSILPRDLKRHLMIAGATEIVDKAAPAQVLTDAVRRHVDPFPQQERRRTAISIG